MAVRPVLTLLLAVSVTVLSGAPGAAQTLYLDEQFGFTLTSSVVYATKPVGSPPVDRELHLQLYQPSGPGVPASRPVVVAIHGGGFTGGSRFSGTMLGLCERMARRGYTCVSIEYRLQGDDPVVGPEYQTLEGLVALADPGLATAIAAAYEDTVAAMQWLVDDAAPLGIDPGRMALAGYSAGGVLTELVGYVSDEAGVVLPAPPRVTFNMSGAFETLTPVVSGTDAALFLSHGDADATVPVSGAYALRDQALAAGLPVELHVFPGKGHTNIDIFSDEVAPGETVFERFVVFAYPYVVPGSGPAVPALSGLGVAGTGLLLAVVGALAAARRR